MSIARHVGRAAPVAAWLLLAALAPLDVAAQATEKQPSKAERTKARVAYDKGKAAFDHGDFTKAIDSFVKANALIPSVQALFWIAQAQDKLGHTESAVEAYEAVAARPDFAKLSEDKATIVRERLAALKPPAAAPPPPPPPPAAAPPAEPSLVPPPAEAPPPLTTTAPAPISPPPPPPADNVLPKRNTAELGVMGGVLFVSDLNNLQAGGESHADFDPTPLVGVRAAFFPVKVFGIEAEYSHGFAHYDFSPPVCPIGAECAEPPPANGSANFDTVRGHLIGQLPTSRVIPFALLGAGIIHEQSDPTGSDSDFALEAGVGLKVMATRLIVPRFDARLSMTQKKGGGFTEGVAVHPELLLGLSFRLGD